MKRIYPFIIIILSVSVFQAQNIYFPPSDGSSTWETIDPATFNWCPEQIDEFYQYLETEKTKSFLLLKDGKIVLEKYFGRYTADSIWVWFSAGKSLRAALIGIAQEEGLLSIHDQTADYLGEGWTALPKEQEDSITIWHQLTMTSGLDEQIFTCTDPVCLRYVADPGTRWAYHNGPYSLLKNVLERASGVSINAYTREKIMNKIGMQSGFWIPSGDNTFFLSRARDMARFGVLILNKGNWDGIPVLKDTAYFNQMTTTSQDLNLSYGYLWWLNGKNSFIGPGSPLVFDGAITPSGPEDLIFAAGAQGQLISISPSTGWVMVRQGLSNSESLASVPLHESIWQYISSFECTTTSTTSRISSSINIYPNPTREKITINGLKDQNWDIQLFGTNGQLLLQQRNQYQMDVSGLPSGLYWLKINAASQTITQKIIKH